MANVNANIIPLSPLGGADGAGRKLGWLDETAFAAPNDTIEIKNITTILSAHLVITSSGTACTATLGGTARMTVTNAETGTALVQGLVVYK